MEIYFANWRFGLFQNQGKLLEYPWRSQISARTRRLGLSNFSYKRQRVDLGLSESY